jgi:membrane protease YdiL (CAAX protease family)
LWIVASVVIAGLTLVVAQALAPRWAADPNNTATVIAAEVYAILIATLFVVFGGHTGVETALRLRPVPARAYLIALAVTALAIVAGDLPYVLAGAGKAVGDSYLRAGADGGRLGVIGPLLIVLSVGRACVLAPIGEELLFRGAVYGWSRRWLPAWSAIVLNSVLWGALSAAIGGSLVLMLPRGILGGFALTWIRERTDSTLPGIAMHVAVNTAVVIVIYLFTGR